MSLRKELLLLIIIKSGFNDLSTHFTSDTCIIFETTGYYSNALTRYLQQKHIKFIELNPFEASLRMAELRRNKNDSNDSFKLAMLGITQYDEIKFRGDNTQMALIRI